MMKSFTARILAAALVLSLAANALLYFRYSTARPLVTVGSDVITKKQFQDQMEHDGGQAVLTKLVFTALVSQAAARAGVTPSRADIEGRLAAIQRQAPQALTPYAGDPVKMAQFRQDLSTGMALENLRIHDVALSPDQISGYYARNQAQFALPQQVSMSTVVTENAVDAGTAADLLRQNDPPDVIGRQRGLHVVGVGGYHPDLSALPPALKQKTSAWAQHTHLGEVKTFPAGKLFLTFQVTKLNPAVVPPLSAVRGEVERAARLELAPSQQEEMARLYQSAKPSFNSDKYAAYFTTVAQYPVKAAPAGGSGAKKTASTSSRTHS